jgi:hypothetical protein
VHNPAFEKILRINDEPASSIVTVGFNAHMSGSYRKLFRESHRDLRLKQWQPGHDTTFEVRPLSLTPTPVKIMRIKDTPDKEHERK